MADITQSTIAQILFSGEAAIDFSKIISELGSVLMHQNGNLAKGGSDHNDLVMFDMAECRILLSWSNVSGNGFSGCLCVSVGPSDAFESNYVDDQLELLCSRLVERIQNRFNPAAVVWRQVHGAVNAELINALIERLPSLSPILLPIDSFIESIAAADRSRAATLDEKATSFRRPELGPGQLEPPRKANFSREQAAPSPSPRVTQRTSQIDACSADLDQDDMALELQAKMSRVRIALYPPRSVADNPTISKSSLQMRLAAHALNATLLIVWLPFGAAITAHSLLNGADFHLSARLMAVCGAFLVVSQPHILRILFAISGV